MLETYKVGVTLEMAGNAQAGIDRLLAQMEKLDRQVKDAGGSFGKLAENVRAIGNAGRSIQSLSRAMEKLGGGNIRGVADFDRMATAAKAMTEASERMTVAMRENARLAADIAKASNAAGRASAAPGRGGSTGRSAGHGVGSHDLMLAGMGASAVGGPLLHGGENAFERGMELAHLRTQILTDSRVSAAQADAMVNKAYEATASAPGTKVSENLHALIDLKQVTGSLEEAEALLPRFARLSAMLQVVDRRKGGSGDSAFAAAKAMELLGGMVEEKTVNGHTERDINPELLQKRLDMIARVAVATNGRVAPQDFLGFAKQARVAGMTLSDEFIYERLPAIMMGMGGPRAGTALMSMAQVFEGGKLTAKSMEEMQKLGLASEGGIEVRGKRKIVHPEAIHDLGLMRTDPDKWVAEAQKRMEAKGIHGSADQIVALMRASQRSTIAGILADFLKDAPVIAKEAENIRATRPDVASYIAQHDPAAKMQQLDSAFNKLVTTLGSSMMDDAVKLMDAATNGLNSLSAWAKEHPTMAKVLTETGTGLGALAAGLGTLSTAIFLFGPALKALGIASGGGAAAAGAATRGGALGVASRVAMGTAGGALGLGAGLIGGALLLGNEVDPIEAEKQINRYNKQTRPQAPSNMPTFDGFDSYGQPTGSAPRVQLRGDIQLDGRKVGEYVANNIGRENITTPRAGATGADVRLSPYSVSIGH